MALTFPAPVVLKLKYILYSLTRIKADTDNILKYLREKWNEYIASSEDISILF